MTQIRRFAQRFRFELGQTTAEYALVMLAAAAVVAVLIAWANGEENGLKDFFTSIIEKISSSVSDGGGGGVV